MKGRFIGALALICLLIVGIVLISDTSEPSSSDPPEGTAGQRAARAERPALPTRTEAGSFRVSGMVLTETDAPVEGVEVAYRPMGDASAATAKTDAEGRFFLDLSAPGTLSVGGATPPMHLVQGAASDLVFRRMESCRLDLVVVTEAGEAVPGYRLRYRTARPGSPGLSSQPSAELQTDASGKLQLPTAPCGVLTFESAVAGQPVIAQGAVDTQLSVEVSLRVTAAVSLEGQVLDAEGAPAVEAAVTVGWGERSTPLSTDQAGRFVAEVPAAEEIAVAVRPELGLELRQTHRSPAADAGPWALTLQLPPSRQVRAVCPEEGSCPHMSFVGCLGADAPSDRVLGEGSCRRSDDKQAWLCACPVEAAVLRSERYEELSLEPGVTEVAFVAKGSDLEEADLQTVRGQVQLSPSAGSCQVGFQVLGGDPQVDRGLGTCSPDGQLSIDLPVGIPVEVVVTSDGHGRPPFGRRATVETEVGAGTSELAPIALAGTGSLTATLVDGAGEFRSTGAVDLQSVASAPVRLRQIGEVRSATGAHFAQLPAGTYELSGGPGFRPAGAQAPSWQCAPVEVTVSAGADVEVELSCE